MFLIFLLIIQSIPDSCIQEKVVSNAGRCIIEPSRHAVKLPVLKNANLWTKKKTSHPEITRITCSFDTIFQLYAASYVESMSFKQMADRNMTSEFIKLVIKFCKSSKDMDQQLRHRELILHAALSDKVTRKREILELDCYMSVIEMFIGIARENEILYSVTDKRRCPACAYNEDAKKQAYQ